VSHDRYFISKTANKIWEIDEGKIKEFKGSYDEWVDWKARMKTRQVQEKPVMAEQKEKKKEEKKPVPQDSEKDKEIKKLQKKFSEAELRVADLQKKKTLAESQLGDPGIYADKNKFQEAGKKIPGLQQAVETG
jgi:ATP-binding cassette subfamily F protein 3